MVEKYNSFELILPIIIIDYCIIFVNKWLKNIPQIYDFKCQKKKTLALSEVDSANIASIKLW